MLKKTCDSKNLKKPPVYEWYKDKDLNDGREDGYFGHETCSCRQYNVACLTDAFLYNKVRLQLFFYLQHSPKFNSFKGISRIRKKNRFSGDFPSNANLNIHSKPGAPWPIHRLIQKEFIQTVNKEKQVKNYNVFNIEQRIEFCNHFIHQI